MAYTKVKFCSLSKIKFCRSRTNQFVLYEDAFVKVKENRNKPGLNSFQLRKHESWPAVGRAANFDKPEFTCSFFSFSFPSFFKFSANWRMRSNTIHFVTKVAPPPRALFRGRGLEVEIFGNDNLERPFLLMLSGVSVSRWHSWGLSLFGTRHTWGSSFLLGRRRNWASTTFSAYWWLMFELPVPYTANRGKDDKIWVGRRPWCQRIDLFSIFHRIKTTKRKIWPAEPESWG